jgi:hypothetical protein
MATPTAAHVASKLSRDAEQQKYSEIAVLVSSLLVESSFGMRSRVFTQPGPLTDEIDLKQDKEAE